MLTPQSAPIDAHNGLKTKVIYNPAANKGRCGETWPRIEARLTSILGPLDCSATSSRGDGRSIARAAFAGGCRRFVAVGGDGTLNEVVNGLMHDDRVLDPGIVFAHIPAGTSNGLSLAIGHPGLGPSADAAFAALAGGATRAIDLFRVDSFGTDQQPRVRYGFLLATLGAPATVGLRAAQVPLLKRLGSVAYVIMSVVTALTYKPRQVRLTIDGVEQAPGALWGAMICSSPTAGAGLTLAPGARIDDGHIDLVSVGDLTRREAVLEIIPRVGDGSFCEHPKVTRHLVQEVHLDSREPAPVDVDGEPSGVSPLRIRVLPQAIKIAVAEGQP